MIHVRQLVKFYGPRLAVDHIDLDVQKGQIVGILGPNGAGKTTTIRILTCFMPPTSGEATINGFDVFSQSVDVRRSIGYLPESNPLYPEMKVSEQLHYFGQLHGLDRSARNRRIGELTESCGLSQIINREIGRLSKGNRQRVGLAQALLHDPPVLILDEPTEGLDPKQISDIRNLIVSLGEKKTILLSSHILPEVEKTCQRVVIIHQGRVAAQGTPAELKAQVRSQSRVILEVQADAAKVKQVLSNVPLVNEVEVTGRDGWVQAAVSSAHVGKDIREALGKAVIENRWPIREMRPETATLEEFFVQITSTRAATETTAA
jgi:ABC-2 type transport system ATP-binding protein